MDRKFKWQEQRTTTPDGVYRVLRTAILDGTVPPGEQLRETHIATDLGISRSPLREALTKLEEEGLVVKIPFRGSFVVEVSARDVCTLFGMVGRTSCVSTSRSTIRLTATSMKSPLSTSD